MAPTLTINLHIVDAVLRVFAATAHLALGAAGAWGFILAAYLWSLSQEYAAYVGIQAVYFTLFGIVAFLAELRLPKLEATVLARLNFLHTYTGRGIFALYVGSIFLFLPWDLTRTWVNRVVGSLELSAGGLMLLFARFAPGDGSSGGARGDKLAGAAAMAWGATGGDAGAGAPNEGDAEAPLASHATGPAPPGSPVIVGNPFLRATGGGGAA
jgi:hypothetical protein